jgi:lipoate-protein ligase A
LSQPAIFRGVILGYNQNGYSIATNIDAHTNSAADTILRKGGSGGAVLNTDGQLIALSVSINSLSPDSSADNLASAYHVRLPKGNYQLAKAQMVDRSTVDSLQTSLTRCN